MIVKDDAELDLTFKFRIDDFDYVVFATPGKMKCFGCNKVRHLIRDCPEKRETVATEQNANVVTVPLATSQPIDPDSTDPAAIAPERAEPDPRRSQRSCKGHIRLILRLF